MQQTNTGLPFADIVEKQPVAVIIHTIHNTVVGEIYLRPRRRLIDEINRTDRFIVVTNALIYDLSGKASLQTHFTAVNRDHIISVVPKDEIIFQDIDSGANDDGLLEVFSPKEPVSLLVDTPGETG